MSITSLLAIVLPIVLTTALPVLSQGQEFQQSADMVRFLEERIREPSRFLQAQVSTPKATDGLAPRGLCLWQVEVVDSHLGDYGGYISLAIDSAGHPHISYYDSTNTALKYAYDDGSGWRVQTVDNAGNIGRFTSLALDITNRPHISYLDETNRDLKYAYYDDTIWQIEAVDTGQDRGYSTSLALDAAGRPHISYYGYDTTPLTKYAYRDAVGWHVQTVDNAGNWNYYTSLRLDSTGRPHIAYVSGDGSSSYALRYARYDSSGWHIVAVDESTWGSHSLALDSADRPHISYCDASDARLKYASHNGTAWEFETVDSTQGAAYSSLILDRDDLPQVSYQVGYELRHARYNGSTWYTEKIDEIIHEYPPYRRSQSSLALDAAMRPHIAFYSEQSVKYAVCLNDLSDWSNLVLASYRDLNYEIYTARGDGAYPVRRTNNTATDTTPKFNRDATKIVFASTRDGNSEIYEMNASNAAQVRLTWNNASDYLPTWSPDDSKIAFYSYRDGNAEIYVMDSDGSNQTRLTSNPAWDGHPTWSPDGSKIVFVSQRSGTYELWTMNSDGSNQQPLSNELGSAAYPDWSPDGAHIAFNYDANGDGWLDLAIINADGTGLSHPIGFSPALHDYLAPAWAPHGEGLVFAKIQWINYRGNWYWVDAYIYSLDLGSNSTHLLVNSGYDWWPDWQTTDALTPSSWLSAPAWSDTITFTVRWSGNDNGPSGLRSYDVQYRDGSRGAWIDWLTETVQTQAAFAGEYEHTYYFRCRARDYAGNLEPYSGGDGDASTHIYRYAITGRVLGNREQPIFAAIVQSSPPALNSILTSGRGDFELYFDQSGSYDVTASRHGFGSLPSMRNVPVTDTHTILTFYLPPTDDQVTDGGFEAGDLAAWSISGEITPVLTTMAHTGEFAAVLGGPVSPTLPGAGPWSSVIEQECVVSPTLTSTTLSVIYQMAEADPISDTFQVSLIGTTQIVTYTLPLTSDGWTHHWWDLSAWESPTLTLRIEWHQTERTRTAGVIIDEVSIGSTVRGAYSIYLPLTLRNEP